MNIDTSQNKYISLWQGNILNIYFWWRKKHFKSLWKQSKTYVESTELPTVENWKKKFFEKWKVANRKLGNLGNLGNIIPSFLIPNSDLKISEKNLRVFWDFRVFRVFDLAHISLEINQFTVFEAKKPKSRPAIVARLGLSDFAKLALVYFV